MATDKIDGHELSDLQYVITYHDVLLINTTLESFEMKKRWDETLETRHVWGMPYSWLQRPPCRVIHQKCTQTTVPPRRKLPPQFVGAITCSVPKIEKNGTLHCRKLSAFLVCGVWCDKQYHRYVLFPWQLNTLEFAAVEHIMEEAVK